MPYKFATTRTQGNGLVFTLYNDDAYLLGASMSDDGRYVSFSQSVFAPNSFGLPEYSAEGCLKSLYVKDMTLGTLTGYAMPKSASGFCLTQAHHAMSGDGKFMFVNGYGPILYRDLVTRDLDTFFRFNLTTGVADNAPRQTGGFTFPNNGTYGYGDPVVGLPAFLVAGASGESFAFMLNAGAGARTKMWHRTIKDVTSGSAEIVGQDLTAIHGNGRDGSQDISYFDLGQDGRHVLYTETFRVPEDPPVAGRTRTGVRYIRYDAQLQSPSRPLLTEFSGRSGEDYLRPDGIDVSSTRRVYARVCGMNADASKLMLYTNIRNVANLTGAWSTGNAFNILVYDVASRSVTLGQNKNMFTAQCAYRSERRPARNMSADGNILVTKDGFDLYVFNVARNKTIRIRYTGGSPNFQISRDGRYILQEWTPDDNFADGSTIRTTFPTASIQFVRFGPILDAYFN